MIAEPFQFKQFAIEQDKCTMKIGTDGVLLGAWAEISNANSILDIGTGSGVIAIMMAQRQLDAIVHAVEVDADSFDQAAENIAKSPWQDRLSVFHQSIQDYAQQTLEKYDLIVSNPPFFSGGTFSQNQDKNNVRHTVKLPHGDLLRSARMLLNKNGRFCVILPYIEGLRLIELAQGYNLYCTKMTAVKPKKDKKIERLLLQFERQQKERQEKELIIQHEKRNHYTKDYEALTHDFYLKM